MRSNPRKSITMIKKKQSAKGKPGRPKKEAAGSVQKLDNRTAAKYAATSNQISEALEKELNSVIFKEKNGPAMPLDRLDLKGVYDKKFRDFIPTLAIGEPFIIPRRAKSYFVEVNNQLQTGFQFKWQIPDDVPDSVRGWRKPPK